VFRNIGMDAVYIHDSTDISVESCDIYDVGLRGIHIKKNGNTDTLERANITIFNNYISDTGRDSSRNRYTAGVYVDSGVGAVIVNNTICNMKNSAIRYSGNMQKIQNNEIYNCVKEAADAGAIYSGRSFTEYGTVIENNYFHTFGAGLTSQEAGAVFWDDKHSGNTFAGNIVDMVDTPNTVGVIIGGGRDNIVENNIFVGDTAVYGADRNISSFTKYYDNAEFKSFTNAANVSDAKSISDDDWKSAYKTKFPNIMANYNELISGKYTRANTIKNNKITGTIELEPNMENESTLFGNTQINVTDELLNSFLSGAVGLNREFAPSKSELSFKLLYPFDNSSVFGDGITLKWSKCYFANSYIYEVSDKADFSTIIASGETYTNTVDITGLSKNTRYYWRVTGVNNSRYLDYTVECSDVYSFTLSEGVYLSSLSYDKDANTISMDVVNDSDDDRTLCFVVALKDSLGNFVDAKVFDNQSIAQTPCTVDTSFDQAGDVIELYIFDSQAKLSPITIKYRFEV